MNLFFPVCLTRELVGTILTLCRMPISILYSHLLSLGRIYFQKLKRLFREKRACWFLPQAVLEDQANLFSRKEALLGLLGIAANLISHVLRLSPIRILVNTHLYPAGFPNGSVDLENFIFRLVLPYLYFSALSFSFSEDGLAEGRFVRDSTLQWIGFVNANNFQLHFLIIE